MWTTSLLSDDDQRHSHIGHNYHGQIWFASALNRLCEIHAKVWQNFQSVSKLIPGDTADHSGRQLHEEELNEASEERSLLS